jgi:periplasmic divalent cation tolerance protein
MPEAERHTKDYHAAAHPSDGDGSDVVVVYATVPTLRLANEIGRALVEGALAACVNILPAMTAIYMWDGALNEDAEVVLIVKTHRQQTAAVIHAVRSRHPYENPALLVLPVLAGSETYLSWVRATTRSS